MVTKAEQAAELKALGFDVNPKDHTQPELQDMIDAARAERAAEGSDPAPEGEETTTDDVEAPEPRESLRIQPYGVVLTEEQARRLNTGEARVLRFMKRVHAVTPVKYAAGDQVMALGSPESTHVRVLPYGVEIELNRDAETEED